MKPDDENKICYCFWGMNFCTFIRYQLFIIR